MRARGLGVVWCNIRCLPNPPNIYPSKVKVKVKVHALDIAPLRNETPPLALPAIAGIHLPTPEGWKASRPWCEVAQAEIRTRNLPIANPALYHTATSAPQLTD